MSGDAVVSLHEAGRVYSRDDAGVVRGLDAVSLSITSECWTALIGANGSGKSTLAALISGAATPTGGRVRRFDSPGEARRRTAVMHQGSAPDPLLTAREYLTLAGRLFGLSGRAARDAAEREAAAFGVSDRLESRVRTLSGGLARRVETARAFVGARDLVVLDEPDAGADRGAREALVDRCLAARDAGAAVVTVTHDAEVARSADRVIALASGRVLADAAPAALLEPFGVLVARVPVRVDTPGSTRSIVDRSGTVVFGEERAAVESAAAALAAAGHEVTLAMPTLADAVRLLEARALSGSVS